MLFFERGALACSWTLKVESRVRTKCFLNVCSSYMIAIQVPISCVTFFESKSFFLTLGLSDLQIIRHVVHIAAIFASAPPQLLLADVSM